jgi:hypothetical protein
VIEVQFFDIVAASAYASICLVVILLLNPVASRELAVEAGDQAALDNSISTYIASVGLVFLSTAPPSTICSSLQDAGNSTLAFGGLVQGTPCGPGAPADALSSASLSLSLPTRTVEIQAWLTKQ